MTEERTDVTRLLHEASRGDADAGERLWATVYEELRRISHRELGREAHGHTLSTTGLVHEAYFKLVDLDGIVWKDREHFYALACRAMRQVLVDRARGRRALKRGAGERAVTLHDAMATSPEREVDLLELDEALTRLASHNERLGRVVEYHFFGGLSLKETAEALGSPLRTVERDWSRAKAFLRVMLDGGRGEAG